MKTSNQPSAFDRFYHGGEKPADAMALAIADAIHAKMGHASALIAYRDNCEALRAAVDRLLPFAEAKASVNEITGFASDAQAAVNSAKRALILSTL